MIYNIIIYIYIYSHVVPDHCLEHIWYMLYIFISFVACIIWTTKKRSEISRRMLRFSRLDLCSRPISWRIKFYVFSWFCVLWVQGGIWEVSERHLGYLGSQGALNHLDSFFAVKMKGKCKSSFKMLTLRCVFEGDITVDGKFTATYAPQQRARVAKDFMGPLSTP